LLVFMIREMTRVLSGMTVYPDRMKRNLELTRGLIFSESVLLALMEKGLTRKAAYGIVQKHALAAWRGKAAFRERLAADRQVRRLLTVRELAGCFDVKRHTRHVKTIFKRMGI